MTTDPKDAEIARYDLDLMESRMVKDQWGGEWVRHSGHAAALADATKARIKAEAERDAALAREAALLASNQANRDLLYQLTGAQSEVTHLRNRFDTAVATARAEGRKEGLREAAEIADAKDPDKPPNYLHRRENIPAAILAAAEKETGNV